MGWARRHQQLPRSTRRRWLAFGLTAIAGLMAAALVWMNAVWDVSASVASPAARAASITPATAPEASPELNEVSFQQYETAYRQYVDCLRSGGFEVAGPLRYGRDAEAGLSLAVGHDPTLQLQRLVRGQVDLSALNSADAKCFETHVAQLEQRWLRQEATRQLSRRAWIGNLMACSQANGLSASEALELDEVFNGVGTDLSDQLILELAHQAIVAHGCQPWRG